MIWHSISLNVRSITSKSIRGPLLHLLLTPTPLDYQNPFSMRLPTVGFPEPLFQCVLMNVGNVVSQTISVKTAQSLRPTTQLKLRKLNLSLMISSSVKISKHNISAAVMMIPQKMTWTVQKTPILHKRHYEVQSII